MRYHSSVTCCWFSPAEDNAAGNNTQCFHKNNVLVYKVETSLKVDSPDSVRVIAVARPSPADVEVQMWKAVEGASILARRRAKGASIYVWLRV